MRTNPPPPMEMPWVILGRVLRGVPGPEDAGAEVEVEAEAEEAQDAAPAAAPDFTIPVAQPPRVNVLAAGRNAHPEPHSPDAYPYIIATDSLGLLAHFDAGHLVLVRSFQTAEGRTTASAEMVPARATQDPVLQDIRNVVFSCSDSGDGDYYVAELQVDKGSDAAAIVSYLRSDGDEWVAEDVTYPLAAVERQWIAHGGAFSFDRMCWWFDLSWGILIFSPKAEEEDQDELLFHDLPDGRALQEATPDIHTRRCVAVSRDKLRYVEIIPRPDAGDAAATVTLWTRKLGVNGWEWDMKYEMSFENIWNHDSYKETRLPRNVPVLALLTPSNPKLVYFALEKKLFVVDEPKHTVVDCEAYELVNMPGPPRPASGRDLVAWELSPGVAQGMDHPQAALSDDEEHGWESEDEEQSDGGIYCKEQLPEEIGYIEHQAAVVDDQGLDQATRGMGMAMDQATDSSSLQAELKKFAGDHHQVSVKVTSSASATLKDSDGSTAEGASANSSSGISTRPKRLLKLNSKYCGPNWISK